MFLKAFQLQFFLVAVAFALTSEQPPYDPIHYCINGFDISQGGGRLTCYTTRGSSSCTLEKCYHLFETTKEDVSTFVFVKCVPENNPKGQQRPPLHPTKYTKTGPSTYTVSAGWYKLPSGRHQHITTPYDCDTSQTPPNRGYVTCDVCSPP
ncbi:hypothetical protein O181_022594 [Austropuccinia psidii MF-1]|uniref:Secreted protein n=1 Tax=Austropuccinia psidii MF-1 TaxID=1389203 RepID=A0A9Q3CCW3_9BASI|nr:hypothetical protein [Austropuccinia psidii MF-1]